MASSANSRPEPGGGAGRPDGGRGAESPVVDWLYRHRGATAVPLALFVVCAARPTPITLLLGALLCAAGEWLRVSALRHVGAHTRGRTLRAPRLATTGPYGRLRHPLYAGNALTCAGLLVASRAGWPFFPALFAALFVGQYALFIRREDRFLAAEFGDAWRRYATRVPALGWAAGEPSTPAGSGAAAPSGLGPALRIEAPTLRTVAILLLLIALRPLLGRVG